MVILQTVYQTQAAVRRAGVPPTQVAEWAGHSVEVLLKIYAKCIDGDAARNRAKIDQALGPSPAP